MVPTQSVGTFNQTGGAVMVTGAIVIGQDEDFYGGECGECVGTYNFTGGTLTDGGYGANLYVRYDAPADGHVPRPRRGGLHRHAAEQRSRHR